jgi:alpha-galactosidase
MASFSDAHETRDIPVIAANLQRLILPRQSQIWAVLHAADTPQRLVYSLTAGFLGRLCISGEITSLTEEQWALVEQAIRFYKQVAPAIKRGTSHLYQAIGPSWQHLRGAQAVLRLAQDACGNKSPAALLVTHSFGAPLPAEIRVPLPGKSWQITGRFPPSGPLPRVVDSELHYTPSTEWEGSAIELRPA